MGESTVEEPSRLGSSIAGDLINYRGNDMKYYYLVGLPLALSATVAIFIWALGEPIV